MNRPAYRPNVAIFSRPSGIATRPSGATPEQVSEYQGTLVWLGHLPRAVSSITGRMPVAPASAIRAFQTNYNAEQAREGYRFSPRTLGVDGDWGPNTEQALRNYVASARRAGFGIGATPAQVAAAAQAAANAPVVEGWGAGPGPSIAPIKADTGLAPRPTATPGAAVRPQTSAPLSSPAPQGAPASTFPVVPVVAATLGVLAIGGAFWYRSRRKGR